MGAWGYGPMESDQALDFRGAISDGIVARIDELLATVPEDEWAQRDDLMTLRGAAELVIHCPTAIGYAAYEGQTQLQHVASRLATALEGALRNKDAMNLWDDPTEVRTHTLDQVQRLRHLATYAAEATS